VNALIGLAVGFGLAAAGAVQAGTVIARLKSALFTGGLGNPVVALLELAGALLLSLLAILAPALVAIALTLLAWAFARIVRRRTQTSRPAA